MTAILLTAVALAAGGLFALRQGHGIGESSLLEIPKDSLDFGDVWSQHNFQWVVPVHNRSNHDVVVSDVAVSCKCMRVAPTSFSVAAGDTVKLSFVIDLTFSDSTPPPGTLREFKLDFALMVDGGQSPPCHGALIGRVKNYLSLSVPARV